MIVVGFDPSLSAFGLAFYNLECDTMMAYCLRPSHPEGARTKAHERAGRASWIAKYLHINVPWGRTIAVCAESLTWPQGIVGAGVIGIAWGVASSVCGINDVPLMMMGTKEVRLRTCGRRDKSKEDVQKWAVDKWPDAGWSLKPDGSFLKAEFGDQADAAAVAWSCAHHLPELQLAIRAGQRDGMWA